MHCTNCVASIIGKDAVVSRENNEEEADGGSTARNNSIHSHRDYVLSVRVNGVELGRGRGGNKGSSKKDASRKALAALILA
jgi:dsRNA-specific ribonuclease